ncbi:MAG: VOC family protein [Deltaproteobacteria bacterium]|nr:VOC family protein [Deltaproteobacteria bacterium]
MGVKLTKDSIDLGIITTDAERALAFYRDTLGLESEGEMPMPGGGVMHRLLCGTSLIKIVVNGREPKATAAPGGIGGSTGYRYWTISVSNLDDLVKRCDDGGYKIVIGATEIRPGIRIAMVEDPDGNWVEFLES